MGACGSKPKGSDTRLGKEKGGIHILNAENSSFQKGNKIFETKNEILKFIHHTIEQLGKEEQVDIVLLSEKVYKSTIDFLQENLNYSLMTNRQRS